ncbi:MAG: NAD(P)H-hydrate epimerase [Terrimesophilobacter sp.]
MGAMINGYTAEQVRAAEAPLLAAGVPLMARAAAGLAREIRTLLPEVGGSVLVLAGSGDNGGDAMYAGAELAAGGSEVAIIATGSRVHEPALAAALAAGSRRENVNDAARLAAKADVIVDGILGTGTSTNPALRGGALDVVEAILPVVAAPWHPVVVAVDIPSGINPNDGSVPASSTSGNVAVLPADVTVTFGGYKAGLLIPPAEVLAGRVVLIDIGLGPELEKLQPVIRKADGEPRPTSMRAGQTGTNELPPN